MLCRSKDVVFAVLGVTGVGKSTFISYLAGFGHGLKPDTGVGKITIISFYTAEFCHGLKPGKLKSLRWKTLISIKS